MEKPNKPNINDYLPKISIEEIDRSVRVFLEWQKTGAWTDTDAEIYNLYWMYFEPLEYGKDDGSRNSELGAHGMIVSYHWLTGELAKRWVTGQRVTL